MATVQSSWWQRTKFSFKESNYITDAWNWLLKLLSKSAEPILFFTVLYSGYELLPGVPQPGPMIDAPVFIVQQAALDIGGLGLMKIAKQVNLGKESYAYRVGMILIVLMIVNVAMASLKKVVTLPPIAFTIIETILLMARAVMAVLYGHAIHSLRDEFPQVAQVAQPAPDMAPLITQVNALSEQITSLSEQVKALQSEQIVGVEVNTGSDTPVDASVNTDVDAEEDTEVFTDEHPIVNIEQYRSEQSASTKQTPKTSTKPPTSSRGGTATQRAMRVIKQHPEIGPTELAKRAKISKSYASQILTDNKRQVVSE